MSDINQKQEHPVYRTIIMLLGILLAGIIGGIIGYSIGQSDDESVVEAEAQHISTPMTRLSVASEFDEFFQPDTVIMILIPAGEFSMGSETGDPDERPIHEVFVDAFYIDQYEVTNKEYMNCVDEGVCREPIQIGETNMDSKYYGDPAYDDFPVNTVNWHMAKTFCEWRGARLPTEPEWEKAAGGSESLRYPWGEEIDCSRANFKDCNGGPVAVGSYESGKSPYGVYDMAGNVWEWVSDPIQHYPYQADFSGQISEYDSRVVRGGGWLDDGNFLRTTNRSYLHPSLFYDYETVGFRCAMSIEQ